VGWLTGRCRRTGASVAALPLAPAAERQYRWTDRGGAYRENQVEFGPVRRIWARFGGLMRK
jgi:hypothetical protein